MNDFTFTWFDSNHAELFLASRNVTVTDKHESRLHRQLSKKSAELPQLRQRYDSCNSRRLC